MRSFVLAGAVIFGFSSPALASASCDKASRDVEIQVMEESYKQQTEINNASLNGYAPKAGSAEDIEATNRITAYLVRIPEVFRAGCKDGDAITIPATGKLFVAKVCDLSKSVVNLGGSFVCAMKR